MLKIANFHNTSYEVAALSDTYKIWVNLRYPSREIKYKFSTHYHPYTDELIETLNRDGLPALLDAKYHKSLRQNLSNWYTPGNFAVTPLPDEEIDANEIRKYLGIPLCLSSSVG